MSIKTALIFSGQGSQYPGMGKKWYDGPDACREPFNLAGDWIKHLCFEADASELVKTDNVQPSVYTVSVACGIAAEMALKEHGLDVNAVAGFSLGEYSALTFAGAFGFSGCLELVIKRGVMMEEAGSGKGGMAAILGNREELVRLINELNAPFLLPVNYNCPGQTVVSGDFESLDCLREACKARRLRYIALNTSGPFHCPVMAEVADRLYAMLTSMDIKEPRLPVYSNLNAKPYGPGEIASKLSTQCKSPVLWEDTLLNMYDDDIRLFIEAGPGKTLAGFVRKTLPGAKVISADETGGYDGLLKAIGEVLDV